MALTLRDRGLAKSFALEGGFDAWQQAGYPLEAKESEGISAPTP